MDKLEKKQEIEAMIQLISDDVSNLGPGMFVYPHLLAQSKEIDPYKATDALMELARRRQLTLMSVPRIRGDLREDMAIEGPADVEEFMAINREHQDYESLKPWEITAVIAFKKWVVH